MPFKDKFKNKEYQKEWARENRATQRRYWRKIRINVLQFLGGKCINCGCDDLEALEINHIHGGGQRDQRKGLKTKQLYLDILHGRKSKNDFDLRCRVCNALHYLTELKGIKDKWKIIYIK